MKTDWAEVVTIIAILVMFCLFSGEPNLMDAIISHLTVKP